MNSEEVLENQRLVQGGPCYQNKAASAVSQVTSICNKEFSSSHIYSGLVTKRVQHSDQKYFLHRSNSEKFFALHQ